LIFRSIVQFLVESGTEVAILYNIDEVSEYDIGGRVGGCGFRERDVTVI